VFAACVKRSPSMLARNSQTSRVDQVSGCFVLNPTIFQHGRDLWTESAVSHEHAGTSMLELFRATIDFLENEYREYRPNDACHAESLSCCDRRVSDLCTDGHRRSRRTTEVEGETGRAVWSSQT
jgi:hypothetical protein